MTVSVAYRKRTISARTSA